MNKAGERTPYYVLNARVRHREHIDIIHRIDRHSSVTCAMTQYSVGLLGEQWRDTKRLRSRGATVAAITSRGHNQRGVAMESCEQRNCDGQVRGGAVQRLIAAALAGILTLLFAWRILLDDDDKCP